MDSISFSLQSMFNISKNPSFLLTAHLDWNFSVNLGKLILLILEPQCRIEHCSRVLWSCTVGQVSCA